MKSHYLHQAHRWDLLPETLFAAATKSSINGIAKRGSAHFFEINGTEFFLKHYQRGGLVRHLIRDSYLYLGLSRTRMWQEFQLLEQLRHLELPVPEPVAARCLYCRPFLYSGDLITLRLPETETLGSVLRRRSLPSDVWAAIGTTVARFHKVNLYHADLNIENILLGGEFGVSLVDFDKCSIRAHQQQKWIPANLQRLLRSLHKAAARQPGFHFSAKDWEILTRQHKERLAQMI